MDAQHQAAAQGSTRERILDAAERLFADRGFAPTSLRAVTDAAGANIAAVNYHFRSKEGLLRAVVARAMAPVNDERGRLLDELEADGGTPEVEDLVRAFVRAGAVLPARHGARGPVVARFIGRVLLDPAPEIRQLFSAEVHDVEGRYLRAFTRVLRHLSPDEVWIRFASMVGLLALAQAGALPDIHGSALPPGTPRRDPALDTDRLVTLMTAGFRAGPTPPAPAR